MRVSDVHAHFMRLGTRVDWADAAFGVRYGNPEVEVRVIAAAWKPCWADMRRAAGLGCTLFVGHESVLREGAEGDASAVAGEVTEEFRLAAPTGDSTLSLLTRCQPKKTGDGQLTLPVGDRRLPLSYATPLAVTAARLVPEDEPLYRAWGPRRCRILLQARQTVPAGGG